MKPATASTLSLAGTGTDVMRDTIARFASALRASSHYIVANNALGQRLWERWWPPSLLVEAAEWLAIEASAGRMISMRPWTTSRILIRGLRPGNYSRLAAEHRVSAAVEIGGTIEAWISLGDRSVDARVAARTSAVLAARYGGDLLGAGARALGHLPGIAVPATARPSGCTGTPRLLTAAAGMCPNAAAIAVEAAAAIGCDVLWAPEPARRQHTGHRPRRLPPRHAAAPDLRGGMGSRRASAHHVRGSTDLGAFGATTL